VSFFSLQRTRPESFSYIGRKGFGPVKIAMAILVIGLFIGAIGEPDGNSVSALTSPNLPVDKIESKPQSTAEKPLDLTLATAIVETADLDHTLHKENIPDEKKRVLTVRNGDTLMSIMLSTGIVRDEAYYAISALRTLYDPKDLRVGQRIHITLSSDDKLRGMMLGPSVFRQIFVRRNKAGSFRAFETERKLTRKITFARGTISSSLYKSAVREEVPPSVLAELVRIYSWDVDFQREIQKGDGFEVAYEKLIDGLGDEVQHGEVIFARMVLSGVSKPLYRFEVRPGKIEYFDRAGRSAKRPLLRTPIDGARLSSRYGKRRHPVLGYTKMHRGVDFAAPPGTPIYAAGDGIVSFRGRKGAFGKYIRIRHAGGFSSAYAHMSRYKKGVALGTRVKQGEIIGFVGSTGRSTGPHLHYEILTGGRQVNPLTIKMPSGVKLDQKDLIRFQVKRAKIANLITELQRTTTITRR